MGVSKRRFTATAGLGAIVSYWQSTISSSDPTVDGCESHSDRDVPSPHSAHPPATATNHSTRPSSGTGTSRSNGSKPGSNRQSVIGHPSGFAGDDDDDCCQPDDPDQGSLVGHLISQLRPGTDLSRVTLPTYFLEPRSMLERITNFMAHPELLLSLGSHSDPVGRFVNVIKFYMSGWHIRPVGVKKPLNPVLGEVFAGYWDYHDGTRGFYISEQTSHHPPKSSYFFMAPDHHIRIDGTLKPRSKFLGNSAGSMMEGLAVLTLLQHNERYFVTQPNIYVRNLLFGRMRYELGDAITIHCPETGLEATIEFKTKGYLTGRYNEVCGSIYRRGSESTPLFDLSGLWNSKMYLRQLPSGQEDMFFDAGRNPHSAIKSRPIDQQAEFESGRLWKPVTTALEHNDQTGATKAKSKIEHDQRMGAAERIEQQRVWKPRMFRPVDVQSDGGNEVGPLDWIIEADVSGATPAERTGQILDIWPILPDGTT